MFLVEAVVCEYLHSHWFQPLSRLPLWTFKVAKLISVPPEMDWTTEHISYNLTRQLSPTCVLGTARKLLWFTSGMATCRVSTIHRLVSPVNHPLPPGLYYRSSDPTQGSQQSGLFPELWIQDFLRQLAAGTSCPISFLFLLALYKHTVF